MSFDVEKYEHAIMSQDHTNRLNAGLELAEAVTTLSAEELERASQPIVDLLLEALRGTDWEFRNLIANALVTIGKHEFIAKSTWFWKKLISTYTDSDAGLRSSAMDLLKELGRSEYSLEILEPLIEGLQHSDKDMRILSANTLGRIKAKEVVPMLLKALNDDNPNVVYNVVECLGDIGDRRAVSALLQLLRDPPDEWVHVATLEALGKIGDQRAVDLLLVLVNKEFVADPLISALGSLGDGRAVPTLIGYIKDDDRDIRELAIKALVKVWEEVESVAALTGVSYELTAIRDILHQSMTSYLKSLVMSEMTDTHAPQEVRENCAVVLSAIEYHKAIPAIVELLETYPLSPKLIAALNRYHKRALNVTLPLLEHQDFRVRQSAGLYLQHLVQQDQVSSAPIKQGLLTLLEDDNPLLQHLALETLACLKASSTIPAFLDALHNAPGMFGDTVVDGLRHFSKRAVTTAVLERLESADEAALPYYLQLLGYSGSRLEVIKTYFKHPQPAIREAAILAAGFTGNPDAIPLLLPFIMSRQHSQTRCAAALSLEHLITALTIRVPKPKNIFDALFVMLNTYKSEEELAVVAHTLGILCSYNYDDITPLNVAVVRGRLLDLLAGVSVDTQGNILRALTGIIDMSSFATLRELRRAPSLEIQRVIAALYAELDKDLRVVADMADMISHSEFSIRKDWFLTAGRLCAIELIDLLVPFLADQNFRAEAFEALVMMGTELLPWITTWLHHEDPRIKKMTAMVVSRISQDHIDRFCTIPHALT